jgi:hypothetical protein
MEREDAKQLERIFFLILPKKLRIEKPNDKLLEML